MTGKRVVILDRRGRARWSDLWAGLPYIESARGRGAIGMTNCGGHRPYIAAKTDERWTWKPYKPIPAEVRFTREELAFAEPHSGFIMVEPSVKNAGLDRVNKAWPTDRWQKLADALPGQVLQCISPESAGFALRGVRAVHTPTFRHALAVLAVSRLLVATEGGLMHGAAAVRTPAVILWTEFIAPEITGYPTHHHIRHAGPPCGVRTFCRGCAASSEAITVAEVLAAINQELKA